jgi:hypothetical protein
MHSTSAIYVQSFLQNPYYFMFASLAKLDDDAKLHWLKVWSESTCGFPPPSHSIVMASSRLPFIHTCRVPCTFASD